MAASPPSEEISPSAGNACALIVKYSLTRLKFELKRGGPRLVVQLGAKRERATKPSHWFALDERTIN